jgi:asparagine synthase (glutamine-hydrolysing)
MAAAGASSPQEQYQQLLDLSFVHRPAFRDLLAADYAPTPPDPEADAGFAYFAESAGLDPLQRFLYLDLKTWLADDLLLKVDKMSMAHGLEARAPFLDHGLVEAALRVPASRKVDAFRSKRLLRAAMAPALPAPILRRRQHGLVLPLDAWFRTSLREYLHDHLHSRQFREAGAFRWSRLEPALARFLAEPGRFAIPLFMLLTFASWLRVFGAQQAPERLDRADPALAGAGGGIRAG